MSKKQWLVLLMLFLTYLLLGAFIFYHIEGRLEIEKVAQAKQERIEINALLQKHYVPSRTHDQHEILEKLSQYCGRSVYNYTEDEVDRLQWDFYNSFYFSYTVVSTIGYGNLAPTNTLSRILMIFYGLVGIPMNGILLTQLGEFFSLVFIRAHRKYKTYKHGQCDYSPKKVTPFETRKVGLAAQIFMYLIPGFVMFIFFPAVLFSHYEGWTYDQSVYYAFVTLTTIGFGDIVAGQDNTKGNGPLFITYKAFLICWISFGLGYIVMIMTFIARGMRSKKITRLEHKLAMNLKHTQSKIWTEFNKDVDYLRRVFNELQLSKVKRIYMDECDYEVPLTKLSRSNSFPDLRNLTIGGCTETYIPPHPRRRANSEVVPADQLTHVVSETDLQRIDKNATFASHSMVQPAELLARLVNILGYIPPPIPPDDTNDWDEDQPKQVDAQNDQYKATESFNSTKQGLPRWTIGGEKFPFAKLRSRATSEVRLQVTKNDSSIHRGSEWTWSGPTASKLQELMEAQRTSLSSSKDNVNKSYKCPPFALPIPTTKNFFPKWRRQFSSKRASDVEANAKNIENVKVRVNDKENSSQQYNSIGLTGQLPWYLDEKRDSILKRPYHTHTGGNLSSYLEGNNLLEETSLADFLRALTALHTQVGTVTDEDIAKPRRKLGTASLTPPKLPSLFTLFSSNVPGSGSAPQSYQNTIMGAQSYQPSRRVSLKLTENYCSGSDTPSYIRKESVAIKKPRRFSLRPVTTPTNSPTPDYEPPRLSYLLSQRMGDRNLQSPYTSMETFISESSKESLMNMEGPPGISSPIKQPSDNRRFSIKPAQLSAQSSPTSTIISAPTHTPKPLPRWKAGKLQRQLGQLNLQRRVRAFSLSDVYSSKREKSSAAPLSPLAMNHSNKITKNDAVDKSSDGKANNANQKTVTIMSPAEEINVALKNKPADSVTSAAFADSTDGSNDKPSVRRNEGKDFLDISREPSAALNESVISRVESVRHHRENGNYETVSADDRPTLSEKKRVLEQRHDEINFNNIFDKTAQKNSTNHLTTQETNTDTKEVPFKMEERKSKKADTNVCVIDNSGESQASLNTKSSMNDKNSSGKEKPNVSIDFYKPLVQVTIEKPAVNPFEQYRAMTKSGQKDEDLREVRVERSRERYV